MKWGVRRYQNSDGSLNEKGKKRYTSKDGSFNEKRYKRDFRKDRTRTSTKVLGNVTLGLVVGSNAAKGIGYAVSVNKLNKDPSSVEKVQKGRTIVNRITKVMNAGSIPVAAIGLTKGINDIRSQQKDLKDGTYDYYLDKAKNSL